MIPGESAPVDARELAEQLAGVLGATSGGVRVELVFQDGRLVNAWTHRKLTREALERIRADE